MPFYAELVKKKVMSSKKLPNFQPLTSVGKWAFPQKLKHAETSLFSVQTQFWPIRNIHVIPPWFSGELPEMSNTVSSKTYMYRFLPKFWNFSHVNEEFSYIFYTLPEKKGKPPWCPFETYHMYAKFFDIVESKMPIIRGVKGHHLCQWNFLY